MERATLSLTCRTAASLVSLNTVLCRLSEARSMSPRRMCRPTT